MTTKPLPIIDVLVVRHSGPLFSLYDIEEALVGAHLTFFVVEGNTLPSILPQARVMLQLGLGEIADDGLRLLGRLHALAAGVPIVVCSSHPAMTVDQRVRAHGGVTFLHRPVGVDKRFIDELIPLLKRHTAKKT